jgi:thiol-disulfide isomerase/thioredoxin
MSATTARLPSLDGATGWLNSEPLDPAALRGKVVLVDFWTLTCINWLRTEPYIRAWADAYRDDGLVVIGVHTPEFSFEHDPQLVRAATIEREIGYPVAIDSDYGVWRAFENHYWPAEYFVDREGAIRDQHFGEGRYEQSERTIQRLLGIEREPVAVAGTGVEAEADWRVLGSPETYLGFARGERLASPGPVGYDEQARYAPPTELPLNGWALSGEWTVGRERVLAGRRGAAISFRFQARDVHLVMRSAGGEPVPFRVLLDGEPPGAASHGLDVDEQGAGVLSTGRLYQLVRQREGVIERTVEIEFQEKGAEAYVFTFG